MFPWMGGAHQCVATDPDRSYAALSSNDDDRTLLDP